MKRSARLGMRVRPEDKKCWEKIAAEQGLSLSAWIEEQLNSEAFEHEARKYGVAHLYERLRS